MCLRMVKTLKFFCLGHHVPEKLLVQILKSLMLTHQVVAECSQIDLFSGKLVCLIKIKLS